MAPDIQRITKSSLPPLNADPSIALTPKTNTPTGVPRLPPLGKLLIAAEYYGMHRAKSRRIPGNRIDGKRIDAIQDLKHRTVNRITEWKRKRHDDGRRE